MVFRRDRPGLHDGRYRRSQGRRGIAARHRGGLADFSYGTIHEFPAGQVPGSLRAYLTLLSDVSADYRPGVMTAGRFHTVAGVVEYTECSERTDIAMWPLVDEDSWDGHIPMTWVRRRRIDTPIAAMGVGVLGAVFCAMVLLAAVVWVVGGLWPGVIATGVSVVVWLMFTAGVVFGCRRWAGMIVDNGKWVVIRSADWVAGLAEAEARWDAGAGPETMIIGMDRIVATRKVR